MRVWQMELRVLAFLSQDAALISVLSNDGRSDVFMELARKLFDIPAGDTVTPTQRTHAKLFVYGMLYGAGDQRLAGSLGIELEQARHVAAQFYAAYPGVNAFLDHVQSAAKLQVSAVLCCCVGGAQRRGSLVCDPSHLCVLMHHVQKYVTTLAGRRRPIDSLEDAANTKEYYKGLRQVLNTVCQVWCANPAVCPTSRLRDT